MSNEFDQFSQSYEDLLHDPIRDRFTGACSEFFHIRKRDLIRDYFKKLKTDSRQLSYLDLGCGKGELATLLLSDFADVTGCDPSPGMLKTTQGISTRVQEDPGKIPFENERFHFVTAVCVYHHVPVQARLNLTREVRRVLKPGGAFCIIEHNPFNPVTRLIVSRTPVDADAVLLRALETRRLLEGAGFKVEEPRFFLYLPERLYGLMGILERALVRFPMGGQYAVFGRAS
jgi:SAM-dependent methyltransferase